MSDLLAGLDPPSHDPGGKRTSILPAGVSGEAIFGGPLDCYRYFLGRCWDELLPAAMIIGMNPSTATQFVADPTIAKLTRMARRWSPAYGSLLMTNTFAYRSTDQDGLLKVDDPIGPDNDSYLLETAEKAAIIICAWGSPRSPKLRPRGDAVAEQLRKAGHDLYALRVTKGRPWHPLYLPDATEPALWLPRKD